MPALAELGFALQITEPDPATTYGKVQIPAGEFLLPEEIQQVRHGGILRLAAQLQEFFPGQFGQALRQIQPSVRAPVFAENLTKVVAGVR